MRFWSPSLAGPARPPLGRGSVATLAGRRHGGVAAVRIPIRGPPPPPPPPRRRPPAPGRVDGRDATPSPPLPADNPARRGGWAGGRPERRLSPFRMSAARARGRRRRNAGKEGRPADRSQRRGDGTTRRRVPTRRRWPPSPPQRRCALPISAGTPVVGRGVNASISWPSGFPALPFPLARVDHEIFLALSGAEGQRRHERDSTVFPCRLNSTQGCQLADKPSLQYKTRKQKRHGSK